MMETLRRQLDELLSIVLPHAKDLVQELNQTEPSPIYQAILDGIVRRTNKFLK